MFYGFGPVDRIYCTTPNVSDDVIMLTSIFRFLSLGDTPRELHQPPGPLAPQEIRDGRPAHAWEREGWTGPGSVCVYIYIYTYIVCVYIYIYICIEREMYTYIYIYIHSYLCICIFI